MTTKGKDAYRTITEVAQWMGTQAHVLRYWENKFDDVKPVKGSGGRRYYSNSDMLLLGGIKHLLHVDGMTLKSVQSMIKTEGKEAIIALSPPLDFDSDSEDETSDNSPDRTVEDDTNVISLTIEPPVKAPATQTSASDDQALLFPELGAFASFEEDTPKDAPKPTPLLTDKKDTPPHPDAPMLRIFDGLTNEPDTKSADLILLNHIPQNPNNSDFAKKAGIISQWFALAPHIRAQIIENNRDILQSALKQLQGTQQNA